MTYYKVKPEHDNKPFMRHSKKRSGTLENGQAFIGNELFTEKELYRKEDAGYIVPWHYFDRIEISKQKTYFSFGARFIQHKYRPQFYK